MDMVEQRKKVEYRVMTRFLSFFDEEIDWFKPITGPELWKYDLLKKEGFWYWDGEPHLDLPEEVGFNDQDFIERLEEIENLFQSARKKKSKKNIQYGGLIHYMGISECRCCEKDNGSGEFYLAGWKWPEGFMHYIKDHGVKPSNDFMKMIDFVYEKEIGPISTTKRGLK